MSDDGAQYGYSAEQAMKATLGGEHPDSSELVTTAQLAERVMATEYNPDEFDYDSCSDWIAKQILLWLQQDPSRAQTPTECVFRTDDNGKLIYEAPYAAPGWHAQMEEDGFSISDLGASGFMWGWAVNAARAILELPEVPNPAILHVDVND